MACPCTPLLSGEIASDTPSDGCALQPAVLSNPSSSRAELGNAALRTRTRGDRHRTHRAHDSRQQAHHPFTLPAITPWT